MAIEVTLGLPITLCATVRVVDLLPKGVGRTGGGGGSGGAEEVYRVGAVGDEDHL